MRANSITASAQPVTHLYIHCVNTNYPQIQYSCVTADSISLAAPHYFPKKTQPEMLLWQVIGRHNDMIN